MPHKFHLYLIQCYQVATCLEQKQFFFSLFYKQFGPKFVIEFVLRKLLLWYQKMFIICIAKLLCKAKIKMIFDMTWQRRDDLRLLFVT